MAILHNNLLRGTVHLPTKCQANIWNPSVKIGNFLRDGQTDGYMKTRKYPSAPTAIKSRLKMTVRQWLDFLIKLYIIHFRNVNFKQNCFSESIIAANQLVPNKTLFLLFLSTLISSSARPHSVDLNIPLGVVWSCQAKWRSTSKAVCCN